MTLIEKFIPIRTEGGPCLNNVSRSKTTLFLSPSRRKKCVVKYELFSTIKKLICGIAEQLDFVQTYHLSTRGSEFSLIESRGIHRASFHVATQFSFTNHSRAASDVESLFRQ